MIEAKAFTTFIRIYSLFKSETNIKLALHKTLIRSIITYACPAWEAGANTSTVTLRVVGGDEREVSNL
jgi:hypothetical protein